MLKKQSLQVFTEKLASQEPVPGGGSTSALAGALGMALGNMVINLTLPRVEGEKEAELRGVLDKALALQEKLLDSVDADAEAFLEVAQVFKLPRATDEEKRIRKEAMQKGLRQAALVPQQISVLAVEALRLLKKILALGSPQVVSDVGVGALLLGAALKGAYLNVQINLNSIDDKDFVRETHGKLRPLLAEGKGLAEDIFRQVESQLTPEKEAK